MAPRRIAAVVLPKLACEIAKSRAEVKGPLAILLGQPGGARGAGATGTQGTAIAAGSGAGQIALPGFGGAVRAAVKESAVIGAVCDEARRYGVRPGQKVTEATALVARLNVLHVSFAEIDRALGRVAEVAMGFGTTVAIQLAKRASADAPEDRSPSGDGPFDTVWIDVTGAAHLRGGEDALLDALGEKVSALGHVVHLAMADGPRVAQALARWGVSEKGHLIAAEGRGAEALAPLPVRALPLPPDRVAFLLRVGVLTVGDLARLPKAEALARLGVRGTEALAVAAGFDPAPLVPFELPPVLDEETSFDEGVQSVEPLLFVLRGATSRLSARLEARGEACTRLDVEMPYDVSIARRVLAERGALRELRRSPARDVRQLAAHDDTEVADEVEEAPVIAADLRERFHVDLPAPLSGAADLFRVLRTKLERTELVAPVTGVRVTVSEIARARKPQLDFARDAHADPNSLPALLAELSAEIGPERVGVLALCDALRPEARTKLTQLVSMGPQAAPNPSALRALAKEIDGRRADGSAALAVASAEGAGALEKDPLCPARMLETPISLGRAGSSVVAVTGQLYVVEKRRFISRIDDVEWWTDRPCSRDYFRATLSSGTAFANSRPTLVATEGTGVAHRSVAAEALMFLDPRTEEAFLQGWFE